MPRPPRRLPAQNTLSYLLLTLTALCGEYPISQISRLPGGPAYLESMVTSLRQSGLLHTFSKDGLRGLRLTSPAKRLLLADAPQWFSDYLTGSSEPNKLKSELSRRLRLHRMAEILTIIPHTQTGEIRSAFLLQKLKGNHYCENMENTDHVSDVGSLDFADPAAHLCIGGLRQRNGHQSNY